MSKDEEMSNRINAACLIQEIGNKLSINQLSMNTGMVYMHRFYMKCSFQKFNFNTMSAACLFLASKVEDQPKKLKYVAKVLLNYNAKKRHHEANHSASNPAQDLKDLMEEIAFDKDILLQVLGFQTTVEHPHSQIIYICEMLKASKSILNGSYFLASISLVVTTMCLKYSSTLIACVCINIAFRWGSFKISKSSEGKSWFHHVDPTISLEKIDDLSYQLAAAIDMYPKNLLKRKGIAVKGSSSNAGSTLTKPSKHPHHKSHDSSSHLLKSSSTNRASTTNHPTNHSSNTSLNNSRVKAEVINGNSTSVTKALSNTVATAASAANAVVAVTTATNKETTASGDSTATNGGRGPPPPPVVVNMARKVINMQEYKERKRLELLQQQQNEQQLKLQQQKEQHLKQQQQKEEQIKLQLQKEQQIKLQLQKQSLIKISQQQQQLKLQQQQQQLFKHQQKEQYHKQLQQIQQQKQRQQKDLENQQEQKQLIKQQLSKQQLISATSQSFKPPSQPNQQVLPSKEKLRQQTIPQQKQNLTLQQQQILKKKQHKNKLQQFSLSTSSFPTPTSLQHNNQQLSFKQHTLLQTTLPPLPSLPQQAPLPLHPSLNTTPYTISLPNDDVPKNIKATEASIKKHRQLSTLLQAEAAKNHLRKSHEPAATAAIGSSKCVDELLHSSTNVNKVSSTTSVSNSGYVSNSNSGVNNVNNVRLSLSNPLKNTKMNSTSFNNTNILPNNNNNINILSKVDLPHGRSYPQQSSQEDNTHERRHHSRKHEKHHKEKKQHHHHHKHHKSKDRESHESRSARKHDRSSPSQHLNSSLPSIKLISLSVPSSSLPSNDSSDLKDLPNYLVSNQHPSSSTSQPVISKEPFKLKLSKNKINPNQSVKFSHVVVNNNKKRKIA